MDLAGKKVLVTGGAVRIGRAIVDCLSESGCDVALQYLHSADAAKETVSRLEARGVRSVALQVDLTMISEVSSLVDTSASALGGLDILINNAAVFHKHSLHDSTPGRLQAELAVNAYAPIALMRAFAKYRDRAVSAGAAPVAGIVNILDRRIAAIEPGALPYQLSKSMLRDATLLAARELGPAIRVNAVAPGPVLPPPGQGDAYLQEHAGPMVLARRPSPQDVAEAVRFLLEADAITGQIIYVDSGQHLL